MNIEYAIEIALKYHKGQKDKSGNPYILHPLVVMMAMNTEEDKIIAVFHDIIEDTECTIQDLKNLKCSDNIIHIIDILTHKNNETYKEYILRIKKNPQAKKIKLADIHHNFSRLLEIQDISLQKFLKEKYIKARKILSEE